MRTQLIASALLAGVMPIDRVRARSDLISGEQLLSAADQVKDFAPRDQFDTPPRGPAWNGRRFSYTVRPAGWESKRPPCAGFPTWDYRNGQLSVSARPQFVNPFTFTGRFRDSRASNRDKIVDLNLYSIRCDQSGLEQVPATNAFGVEFPVRRWTEDAVGIFDTGTFDPGWKVYWGTQLGGGLAREISRNLVVRISGSLQAWPNGSMIVCGTDQNAPTITTPTARTRKICGFNGRPDRIEFLNAATGQVLFQIARKPSSAAGSR